MAGRLGPGQGAVLFYLHHLLFSITKKIGNPIGAIRNLEKSVQLSRLYNELYRRAGPVPHCPARAGAVQGYCGHAARFVCYYTAHAQQLCLFIVPNIRSVCLQLSLVIGPHLFQTKTTITQSNINKIELVKLRNKMWITSDSLLLK